MYYVYILKSKKDNSLYKGYTSLLIKRLEEHNNGKSIYTSTKMPWILVYFEKFDTQKDAIAREKYLKSAAGRRFLKNVNLEQEVDLNTV
ncbi:MAG TPA: GIY-YIG nuclease family protein [Chitinophagales bacterium]|nr:GIY-YIG nuclease family protein [Chitinophagales bacterium]